jgi:hypothetical protein
MMRKKSRQKAAFAGILRNLRDRQPLFNGRKGKTESLTRIV